MSDSTRRRRARQRVPALLLVLVTTTGWAQSAPAHSTPGDQTGPGVAEASVTVIEHRAARDDLARLASRVPAPVGSSDAGFSSVVNLQEPAVEPVLTTAIARVVRAEPVKVAVPTAPTYSGTNRFWIPSLGMNYRVHLFECTRSRPPDNYMYRWGCAGRNNVYILGHAYSVMKPLHDLYVRGGLRKGMLAVYADGNGRVRSYRVTEWRVVDPVDSHWAIADQRVPSMTLQTCVGPGGVLRLNVRLVAVD
jgi:hypothetical protein